MTLVKLATEEQFEPFLWQMMERQEFSAMLSTPEQRQRNLSACLVHPDDLVLGCLEDSRMVGLFSFCAEPSKRYLEMLVGVTEREDVCAQVLEYLKENYPGFRLDAVFHPNNIAVRTAIQKAGATLDPVQATFHLKKHILSPSAPVAFPLTEEGITGYLALHNQNCYWTGQRVLEASHIFRVFIVFENEKIVGYVDVTHNREENEIYDLYVRPESRNRGFGKALLSAVIAANGNRGLMSQAEMGNEVITGFLSEMGFEVEPGQESIYACLKL